MSMKNIMLKNSLSILIFCIFFINNLIAQTVIHGSIDTALHVVSFQVQYATNMQEANNMTSRAKVKEVKVIDGNFKIEWTDDLPDYFYVDFIISVPKKVILGDQLRNFIYNQILWQANTETSLKIGTNNIIVDGLVKDVLNSQMDLFLLNKRSSDEKLIIKRKYNFEESQDLKRDVIDYLQELKINYDLLEKRGVEMIQSKYQSLPLELSNQILYDFIGDLRQKEINKLGFYVDLGQESMRPYIVAYYLANYLKEDSLIQNGYLGNSYAFPIYLAQKAHTDVFMALSTVGNRMFPNIQIQLDLISQRYEGDLYDQVAFAAFLRKSTANFVDDISYASLIANINNREFNDYIKEFRIRRSKGGEAFHFNLMDETGKFITNDDFKGRVMVLDFWFTGCRGCRILHNNMKLVKQHFKNNAKVSFVNICIDKKEDIWRNSLLEGGYTDKESTNLWLGVENREESILKHYDVNSYPTLIIIDGNNKIVAMNPPTPGIEKNRNALIGIIEEALKN